MKAPWQMTRGELVPFLHTFPCSHVHDAGPRSWSEEDLHEYTLSRRHRETLPPHVPHFALLTWSMDLWECLWQLAKPLPCTQGSPKHPTTKEGICKVQTRQTLSPECLADPACLLRAVREMAVGAWRKQYPDIRISSIHDAAETSQWETVEAWKVTPPEPGRGWRVFCSPDSYERCMTGESLSSYLALDEDELVLVETFDSGQQANARFWQDVYGWSPAWRRPFIAKRAQQYGIVLPAQRRM